MSSTLIKTYAARGASNRWHNQKADEGLICATRHTSRARSNFAGLYYGQMLVFGAELLSTSPGTLPPERATCLCWPKSWDWNKNMLLEFNIVFIVFAQRRWNVLGLRVCTKIGWPPRILFGLVTWPISTVTKNFTFWRWRTRIPLKIQRFHSNNFEFFLNAITWNFTRILKHVFGNFMQHL